MIDTKRGLAAMVYKVFVKKSTSLARSENLALQDKSASGEAIKNEFISNKELAEELHKLIITSFKKKKAQSPFIDNIWVADLADMQLISNKGIRFLLCVIHIFSKYAWVIPLKDRKVITITNTFQKI